MNIHLQVVHLGEKISLSEAIRKGYVQIIEDKIEAQNNTTILLSSKLFDCNGQELFENDIVQTYEGKKYQIIYDFGLFYLLDIETKNITPLYIYKLGNTIDVEKIFL